MAERLRTTASAEPADEPARPLRVAVAQTSAGSDRELNLATAVGAIERAADGGARLVVLPEYSAAYDPRGVHAGLAEPLDGPFVTGVAQVASRHGVHVCLGTLVPAGRRASNLTLLLGPDGAPVARYTKAHLYDAFGARESESIEPGPALTPETAPVADVRGVRVGLMTCYDLRFPESARILVDAGAQVLLVPAAWVAGEHKIEQLRVLARARAVENTAYVVVASMYGPGLVGHSMVVDPHGVVVTEADDRSPGLLGADVDPGLVARVRERNPALLLRRYRVVPAEPPAGLLGT